MSFSVTSLEDIIHQFLSACLEYMYPEAMGRYTPDVHDTGMDTEVTGE